MRVLIILGAFFVTSFLCNDCTSRISGETENSAVVSPSENQANGWEEVGLPIDDAKAFTTTENEIFLIGVKGFAIIDISNLHSRKIEINNLVSRLTKNGGLSFIKTNIDNADETLDVKKEDFLCSSESAAIVRGTLYSYGPCEHTGQFWKFDLTGLNKTSYVINFTYATDPHSNTNDPVYGPNKVLKTGNRVLLPSNLKDGPAIFEIVDKPAIFKKIWQGKKADGYLSGAVGFFEGSGWMVTGKGKLLFSKDKGTTWNYLPDLPEEVRGKILNLEFQSLNDGFIFGSNGVVFRTLNGGNTWSRNNTEIGITGSVYKISSNASKMAVLTTNDEIFLYDKKNELWVKINFEKRRPISDALLLNNELFILYENHLYKRKV